MPNNAHQPISNDCCVFQSAFVLAVYTQIGFVFEIVIVRIRTYILSVRSACHYSAMSCQPFQQPITQPIPAARSACTCKQFVPPVCDLNRTHNIQQAREKNQLYRLAEIDLKLYYTVCYCRIRHVTHGHTVQSRATLHHTMCFRIRVLNQSAHQLALSLNGVRACVRWVLGRTWPRVHSQEPNTTHHIHEKTTTQPNISRRVKKFAQSLLRKTSGGSTMSIVCKNATLCPISSSSCSSHEKIVYLSFHCIINTAHNNYTWFVNSRPL